MEYVFFGEATAMPFYITYEEIELYGDDVLFAVYMSTQCGNCHEAILLPIPIGVEGDYAFVCPVCGRMNIATKKEKEEQ